MCKAAAALVGRKRARHRPCKADQATRKSSAGYVASASSMVASGVWMSTVLLTERQSVPRMTASAVCRRVAFRQRSSMRTVCGIRKIRCEGGTDSVCVSVTLVFKEFRVSHLFRVNYSFILNGSRPVT